MSVFFKSFVVSWLVCSQTVFAAPPASHEEVKKQSQNFFDQLLTKAKNASAGPNSKKNAQDSLEVRKAHLEALNKVSFTDFIANSTLFDLKPEHQVIFDECLEAAKTVAQALLENYIKANIK